MRLSLYSFHQQFSGQSGGRGRGSVGADTGPAAAPRRGRDEPDQREREPGGQGVLGGAGGHAHPVPLTARPLRPLPHPAPPVLHAHRPRGALPLAAPRHQRGPGPCQSDQVSAASISHRGNVQRYQVILNQTINWLK